MSDLIWSGRMLHGCVFATATAKCRPHCMDHNDRFFFNAKKKKKKTELQAKIMVREDILNVRLIYQTDANKF